MNTISPGMPESVPLKRHYRNVRSKLKRKLRNGAKLDGRIKKKYNINNLENRRAKYLAHVHHQAVRDWLTIQVPEVFCFISDHDGTFVFFDKLGKMLGGRKPKNLHLVHTKTRLIGLSASYLFDDIVNSYVVDWRNKGFRVQLGGETGSNTYVNNFLLSFGFLSEGNFDGVFPEGFVDPDYRDKYEIFKFRGSKKRGHAKSNAATELSDYFRKCYRSNNHVISDEAHGCLADAFGEIIGNAEEHANANGDFAYWNVMGYYEKDNNYCKFAIINFGRTIFDNLIDANNTLSSIIDFISKKIEHQKSYLERLKAKAFNPDYEEPMWNVMALQDGISSKRTDSGRASTRGQGLMDVLEFISELKSDEDVAEIAVISGRSKILIDFDYPIVRKHVGQNDELRRQIIFNREGSLDRPQDNKKVLLMKDRFEGTIITGRLIINDRYLDNVQNSRREDE